MISAAEVYAALRAVPDPCGLLMRDPVDVVTLGLVEGVTCADGRVRIALVLTDPSCVHLGGIRGSVTDAVAALPGVREVEVVLATDVLWTPDRRGPRLGVPLGSRGEPAGGPSL